MLAYINNYATSLNGYSRSAKRTSFDSELCKKKILISTKVDK